MDCAEQIEPDRVLEHRKLDDGDNVVRGDGAACGAERYVQSAETFDGTPYRSTLASLRP
jgi:hypothetical protein